MSRKGILCKLGFHKPNKYRHVIIRKQRGKHKWQRRYVICERCGKLLPMTILARTQK